jgi:aspartyl-tRNA(Asn)/glutamyl-tRNA(Gln) amidotransferase subunit A
MTHVRWSIDATRTRVLEAAGCNGLVRALLERAREPAAQSVYTQLDSSTALQRALEVDTRGASRAHALPLHGMPVSIKDLFDVAGEVTAAGSQMLRDAPAAERHAPAVARLEAAGAVLVGRTNMSEFAFSGVGINPHHGTPRNPCDAALHRIPGGSSSGAAVSVALGLAVAGLGSDTGGSLRIPAALCGLVGFKPTQSRVPRAGAFELARTLDTVGAITTCVRDALAIDAVIADKPLGVVLRELPAQTPRAALGLRLAVPRSVFQDDLEPEVARAFDAALRRLRDAGATLVELNAGEFAEIPKLNSPGGLSATEAYAVHRAHFDTRRSEFDPRVARRIELGRNVSAADYLTMLDARREWMVRVQAMLDGFDAFVGPTVPLVAPAVQPLLDSDETFFRINGLLLRNTFVVNFLDGCAFSLPCQADGALPVGLTVAGPCGSDARVAAVALVVESVLSRAAVPRAG